MNTSRLIGITATVLLLIAAVVAVTVINSNKKQDMNSHNESSESVSDTDIRDGLMMTHHQGMH